MPSYQAPPERKVFGKDGKKARAARFVKGGVVRYSAMRNPTGQGMASIVPGATSRAWAQVKKTSTDAALRTPGEQGFF